MHAILSEIWSSLWFWEIAGYLATAIVILGCVGEYIAEFTKLPRDQAQQHKISKLSLIILTLGIAGELLTAVRVSVISGTVIQDLQASVVRARNNAVAAEGAASRAETSAGDAASKAEGVDLKATAIDGRLKTASQRVDELDSRLAWRHVDPKKRAGWVMELSPYRDSSVMISIEDLPNDEEKEWRSEIVSLFHDAGWITQTKNLPPNFHHGIYCYGSRSTPAGKAFFKVVSKFPGEQEADLNAATRFECVIQPRPPL